MEIELDLKLAGWKERTVFAVYVYIASANSNMCREISIGSRG